MASGSESHQATIEDVARRAGVSRAAVSKVIRNAYGVSDSMRSRVSTAIQELDYRPRVAARAMRGQTFTIGIEIPDFANQFFARVLEGARRALTGTSYQLVIAPAEPGPNEGLRALEALIDRQMDALIAVSPQVDQSALERLAHNTPVVMFGRHDESQFYDTVATDDEYGTRVLMHHLLSLGHERITHLSLSESATEANSGSAHSLRLAAYVEAMSEAGLAERVVVRRTAEGEESAYEATKSLLEGDNAPTAIFAAHDALALGALRAVIEANSNVSVAGYDGVPIASHPGISLTTVNQRGEDMGHRAASMLLERLSGREGVAHETFQPELVVRHSTRPPVPSRSIRRNVGPSH